MKGSIMAPSKSKSQERFRNIAAHSEKFREDHDIDEELAREWHEADKAKHAESSRSSESSRKKER